MFLLDVEVVGLLLKSDLGVWRLGRQDPVGCSVVTACAQVTEEAYTAGLEKEKTHGLP